MKKEPPLVPVQRTGIQKDTIESVSLESPESARDFFQVARRRLLDVNHWHDRCAGPSSTFTLHDAQGQRVERPAEVGDYFEIILPGPGPVAGDGADWVRIEAIDEQHDETHDVTSVRVRPAPSPRNAQPDVAHFLSDSATSTFVVTRTGSTVSADVHGRNEVPNSDAERVIDTVRNVATAIGAFLGLADVQWGALVKALVRREG